MNGEWPNLRFGWELVAGMWRLEVSWQVLEMYDFYRSNADLLKRYSVVLAAQTFEKGKGTLVSYFYRD